MAKILIIDDETNIRMMLRLALMKDQHQTDAAAEGLEGLEKFGDGSGWDLVLLDQRMPGMEGLEVLREMRRRRPDARIVMMTAFGTIDLALAARQAGASNFLRKPFTVETLRAAAEAALSDNPMPEGNSPIPLSFDLTTVNAYHLHSLPGLKKLPDGSLQDEFEVRPPGQKMVTCQVTLPPYLIELVLAYADRNQMPGEERFWQALCGESLANYLWQHAEMPENNLLVVDDLTSGLKHWIDAVIHAE
jgi:CheY-like chemotaxis protein